MSQCRTVSLTSSCVQLIRHNTDLPEVLENGDESEQLLSGRGASSHDADGLPALESEAEALSGWRLICSSFVKEGAAMREGWSYVLEPSHRSGLPLYDVLMPLARFWIVFK
jgi:hypothetical protein